MMNFTMMLVILIQTKKIDRVDLGSEVLIGEKVDFNEVMISCVNLLILVA